MPLCMGGHAFGGGGGRAFSGFTDRGFSPGFMGGGRHFSGASARDFAFHDGRFNSRFFAHDRFFRHHHRFVSNLAFVGFGFPDWDPNYYGSYPDDYSANDGEPDYDDQYLDESSVPTQSGLAQRANDTALVEGIGGFGVLSLGSSNDGIRYRSISAEGRATECRTRAE